MMKRLLCVCLALVLICAGLPALSRAESFTLSGSFQTIGEDRLVLTGWTRNDSIIALPCFVDEGVVFIIGRDAFTGLDRVQHIALPTSVVAIESGAFADCKMLRTIIIPETVTSIAADAFDLNTLREDLCVITPSGSSASAYCRQNGIHCIKLDSTRMADCDETSVRLLSLFRHSYGLFLSEDDREASTMIDGVLNEVSLFDSILYGIADRDKILTGKISDIFGGSGDRYMQTLCEKQIGVLLKQMDERDLPDISLAGDLADTLSDISDVSQLADLLGLNYGNLGLSKEDREIIGHLIDLLKGTQRRGEVYMQLKEDCARSKRVINALLDIMEGDLVLKAATRKVHADYVSNIVSTLSQLADELEKEIIAGTLTKGVVKALTGEAFALYTIANLVIDSALSMTGISERKNALNSCFASYAINMRIEDAYDIEALRLFNTKSVTTQELSDAYLLVDLTLQSRVMLYMCELDFVENAQTRADILELLDKSKNPINIALFFSLDRQCSMVSQGELLDAQTRDISSMHGVVLDETTEVYSDERVTIRREKYSVSGGYAYQYLWTDAQGRTTNKHSYSVSSVGQYEDDLCYVGKRGSVPRLFIQDAERLSAFELYTGAREWTISRDESNDWLGAGSFAQADDGTLYLLSWENCLYAVSEDGQYLWLRYEAISGGYSVKVNEHNEAVVYCEGYEWEPDFDAPYSVRFSASGDILDIVEGDYDESDEWFMTYVYPYI